VERAPAVEAFVEEMGAAAQHRRPRQGPGLLAGDRVRAAEERAAYVAFQDADVTNFSRQIAGAPRPAAVEPTWTSTS